MIDLSAAAAAFAADHASGRTLVLPTSWDVWSASLVEQAGFPGATIGSHPVANSLGYEDGEQIDVDTYFGLVKCITAAVGIPVSVDVESGYGLDARELASRVMEAGAVGMNVEDTVHSQGGRIRDRDEHADYIAAIRQACDEAGVEVVINGRTDALIHGTDAFEDPLAEAVARVVALEAAGARSVYPVKLPDAAAVSRLVAAVSVPVNVTADPRTGSPAGGLAELTELGVRRISFGPLWQAALGDTSSDWLGGWKG